MREKILEVLQDIRPDIDFENETGLITEGILESFDLLTIIASLEEAVGIEIDPANMSADNFDSLAAIIAMVERIQNA